MSLCEVTEGWLHSFDLWLERNKNKGGRCLRMRSAHTQLDGGVVATHPGRRYTVGIGRVSGSLCEVTEGQPHSFDFLTKINSARKGSEK